MVQLLGIFGFLVVLLRAAILCFQTVAIGGILFLALVARKGGMAERGTAAFKLEADSCQCAGPGDFTAVFCDHEFAGADLFDGHPLQGCFWAQIL